MGTASEIERLESGKAGIVASIRAKGVDVPDTDRLDDLPARIDAIEGSAGVLELSVLKDATGLTGGLETTGKVTSATISPKAGSQVGKTVIYGSTKKGQGRLPEGYTELEYIESTGTQYIDTGLKANQNTGIELDFALTSAPSGVSKGVIGARNATNSGAFLLWLVSSHEFRFDFQNANATIQEADTSRHSVSFKSGVLEFDSSQIKDFGQPSFSGSYGICLFTANSGGSKNYYSSAKIYSARFFNGSSLVMDFVPCKNSGGTVGMYDLVGAKFYANSGTGSFVAGSEIIVPDEPMSQVALTLNGQRWEIDLGGNTLGEGQVLTIGATGAAKIDGMAIPDQQMPTFAGGQVEIATASSMEHYFDLEYQPA